MTKMLQSRKQNFFFILQNDLALTQIDDLDETVIHFHWSLGPIQIGVG